MDEMTRKVQEMYDDFRFRTFEWNRRKYHKPLFSFLSKIKQGHRVYDIGCGSGYFLPIYSEVGITKEQITALDLSSTNIENLKKRGYNAICGNVLFLPFPDNVSDFTICNGVIHHTRHPFLAFKELVRITKPGGYIYLNVYNIWHPWFYIVHKATFFLRFIYWNWTKKIGDIAYQISKVIFQPVVFLYSGKFANDEDAKIAFMDQVFTPYAFLFSKSKLLSYAKSCNCYIEKFEYDSIMYSMIIAQLKVNNK